MSKNKVELQLLSNDGLPVVEYIHRKVDHNSTYVIGVAQVRGGGILVFEGGCLASLEEQFQTKVNPVHVEELTELGHILCECEECE